MDLAIIGAVLPVTHQKAKQSMSKSQFEIRPFAQTDSDSVISLWQACDLTRPWNDPRKDIARKQLIQPELFLVATDAAEIVGSVMAGYEGHRGWINYLAVHPLAQRQGLGKPLMDEAQARLLAAGCPKVNLQVRSTNEAAVGFYKAISYTQDEVVSYGKRLVPD
jgi:ribosomal protein S18 acetylase RimI-like enzyme